MIEAPEKQAYIEKGLYTDGNEYWFVDIATKEPGNRVYKQEIEAQDAALDLGYEVVKKPISL